LFTTGQKKLSLYALRQPGGPRGRYSIQAQATVRPVVIMIHPPALHNVFCLIYMQEQLAVEAGSAGRDTRSADKIRLRIQK